MTASMSSRASSGLPLLTPAVHYELHALSTVDIAERCAGLEQDFGVTAAHRAAWGRFYRHYEATGATRLDTSRGLVMALRTWANARNRARATAPEAVLWLCAEMAARHRPASGAATSRRDHLATRSAHFLVREWSPHTDHGWLYVLAGMKLPDYLATDPPPAPSAVAMLLALSTDLPPLPPDLLPS